MATSNSESGAAVDKKRPKYMTKVVKFGKENLTLYSIDGNTWSSRRQELTDIMNRHEQERLKSIQAMGEPLEGEKGAAEEGAAEEAEQDEVENKDEGGDQDLEPVGDLAELDDEEMLDDELEDEAPVKAAAKGAGKSAKAAKPPKGRVKGAVAPKAPAKKASQGSGTPKTSAKKKPVKGTTKSKR